MNILHHLFSLMQIFMEVIDMFSDFANNIGFLAEAV